MTETNDGGPAFPCAWCQEAAARKQGRIYLCAMHYRHQQMRGRAKANGKAVPSYAELASMTPQDMLCPHCGVLMNWLAADGQKTVATLQHNRDGSMQFLCRSCNTRHAHVPGDGFYDLSPGHRWCCDCKAERPVSEFQKNGGRLKPWCRSCTTKRHNNWVDRNRDYVNFKQRELRAKRKADAMLAERERAGGEG